MIHISKVIKAKVLNYFRECMVCELMCIPSKMYDKDICYECNNKIAKERIN